MQNLTQAQRDAINVLVPPERTSILSGTSTEAARHFAVLRGHNPTLARYLFRELVNSPWYGRGLVVDYALIDVWLSSVVRMGLQFDDVIEYRHSSQGGAGYREHTRARVGVALVRAAPYFPRAVYNASAALFQRTIAESAERLQQNTGTQQDEERVERGMVGLAQELLIDVCNDRYMETIWETANNQGEEQKGFMDQHDTPGKPPMQPLTQLSRRVDAAGQLEYIMADIIGLCLLGAQVDAVSLQGTTLGRFFAVVDEFRTEKDDAEADEDRKEMWHRFTHDREYPFWDRFPAHTPAPHGAFAHPAQLHEATSTWLQPKRDLADFLLRPYQRILTNAQTSLPWLLSPDALPAPHPPVTSPFEVLEVIARRIRVQFQQHVGSRALQTVAERAAANPRVQTLFLSTDEYSQFEILELMVNKVLFPVCGTNGWRGFVSFRQMKELWQHVLTEFAQRESEAETSRKRQRLKESEQMNDGRQ